MAPYIGDFTNNLLIRFSPSEFEDFTSTLIKLCQKMTMQEYQIEFEKLDNHTEGLDDALFHSYFINGLKDEI